jgi:hypothetical protein
VKVLTRASRPFSEEGKKVLVRSLRDTHTEAMRLTVVEKDREHRQVIITYNNC